MSRGSTPRFAGCSSRGATARRRIFFLPGYLPSFARFSIACSATCHLPTKPIATPANDSGAGSRRFVGNVPCALGVTSSLDARRAGAALATHGTLSSKPRFPKPTRSLLASHRPRPHFPPPGAINSTVCAHRFPTKIAISWYCGSSADLRGRKLPPLFSKSTNPIPRPSARKRLDSGRGFARFV